MKPLLTFAALLLSLSLCHAQDEPVLQSALVPLHAQTTRGFAPRGWKIEQIVRGDLNRDHVPDAALVLIEDKPAKDKHGDALPRSRALVVALKEKSGWKRVGFSGELLMGTQDGGAFYDMMPAPVSVSIRRGVLIVGMEHGSREVEETTHRLRFQPGRGMVLIGFDSTTRDRATGGVVTQSSNFLTGRKTTTTLPAEKEKSTTKESRVPTQLLPLESLKEDDRYAK